MTFCKDQKFRIRITERPQKTYLVEEVVDHGGDAGIEEMPVNEENATDESELGKCKIRRVDRLSALLAHQSKADVCLLNHGHIIRTITDCRRHWMTV